MTYTHYVALCCISFSHECVHIGQMDFITCISYFVIIFCKIIWKTFHRSYVTDVDADQSPLFVHSTLMCKQSRLTQISGYIHVPFDHVFFIILGQAV